MTHGRTTDGQPRLCTSAEAAARLGVSPRQFARLCRQYGVVPDGQTPGQVRSNLYSEAAIQYLLQETGKADHGLPDVQTGNEQTDTAEAAGLPVALPDHGETDPARTDTQLRAVLAHLAGEITAQREIAEREREAARSLLAEVLARDALIRAQAERIGELERAAAARVHKRPWWRFW